MTASTRYRWRRLTPDQECEVRRLRGLGVSAVAIAARYGVDRRTIYRYLLRDSALTVLVAVDDWAATFEMTADGPVQVSPWEWAESH